MAKFQIEIKECLRIKKEFIAMIEEMKDYEKRLYAVKENLEKMSEYTGKETGQIIDFYEGTSLDGFINIRQVQ